MRDRDPERPVDETNELTPAVEWIRERGGTKQCAKDLLKMTAGDPGVKVLRAALKEAGAPSAVMSLVWQDIFWMTKK